jgi:hypothetical protein
MLAELVPAMNRSYAMNIPSLNRLLRANAAFSVLCATDFLLFSRVISQWMGIENPLVLIILAIGLLMFASFLLFIGFKSTVHKNTALGIIAADIAWVVASLALLVFNPFQFTHMGLILTFSVACVVAVFAVLQILATRRQCALPV